MADRFHLTGSWLHVYFIGHFNVVILFPVSFVPLSLSIVEICDRLSDVIIQINVM